MKYDCKNNQPSMTCERTTVEVGFWEIYSDQTSAKRQAVSTTQWA